LSQLLAVGSTEAQDHGGVGAADDEQAERAEVGTADILVIDADNAIAHLTTREKKRKRTSSKRGG